MAYNLGFSVNLASDPFARTKVITIAPRYIMVNALSRAIECRQAGPISLNQSFAVASASPINENLSTVSAPEVVRLGPESHTSYHWPYAGRRREVRIRFTAYGWEWSGNFSLNDIGDFALRLRNKHTHQVYLMRVEIKDEGPCRMIYFREEAPSVPPYRIENYSLETFRLYQRDVKAAAMVLLPYHTCAYSWDERTKERQLVVELLPSGINDNAPPICVGTLNIDQIRTIAQRVNSNLHIELLADGPTRVLRFQDIRNVRLLGETQAKSSQKPDTTRSSLDFVSRMMNDCSDDIECLDGGHRNLRVQCESNRTPLCIHPRIKWRVHDDARKSR